MIQNKTPRVLYLLKKKTFPKIPFSHARIPFLEIGSS